MPIAKLFIEGNLESEILNPILQGSPVLQRGGSKNSLRPRARAERKENKVAAGYLRDRDFDYDPPVDISQPTLDYEDDGVPIGWRWCRHEIENYLIEPTIVSEATAWQIKDVEQAILQSARVIRNYEAARWTVGKVRRALPPRYEMRTRPDDLNEIALPMGIDPEAASSWASTTIETHRNRIDKAADPSEVIKSFDAFVAHFDDDFVADVSNVLLWFSGKDILAGMTEWLNTKTFANPGAFRASMRDWVIGNPERTLELLPEWNNLTVLLKA
jgi:hypothetical protein